jgi:hypothetical protein
MQTDLSFSTAFRISKYSPGDLAEIDIVSSCPYTGLQKVMNRDELAEFFGNGGLNINSCWMLHSSLIDSADASRDR